MNNGTHYVQFDRAAAQPDLVETASRSEDEFLSRQASDAVAAIRGTVGELLDVSTHVRSHPWWAVGSACLAGIVTGRIIRPKPRSSDRPTHQPTRNKGLLYGALTTVLREAVKFLLPALFGGAVVAKTVESEAESARDTET